MALVAWAETLRKCCHVCFPVSGDLYFREHDVPKSTGPRVRCMSSPPEYPPLPLPCGREATPQSNLNPEGMVIHGTFKEENPFTLQATTDRLLSPAEEILDTPTKRVIPGTACTIAQTELAQGPWDWAGEGRCPYAYLPTGEAGLWPCVSAQLSLNMETVVYGK